MTNILSQKAVLARLSVSLWAGRTTDQKVTGKVLKEHNAKSNAGIFTKRLINKEALAEVVAARDEAVRNWRFYTQPWLDGGVRILPTALYLECAGNHGEIETKKFKPAVASFLSEYKRYIGDAEGMLGTMFTAGEYPPLEVMRQKFEMTMTFMPCPDAEDFRCDIDDKHLDTIKDALESQMDDQLRSAVAGTAERVVEICGHMADRLSTFKPATKKGEKSENTFRDSLVENVRDIAKLLPAFNLDNDPKFDKLINRINKELCVHEAETLRKDDSVRKKVAKSAKEITKAVEEFLA